MLINNELMLLKYSSEKSSIGKIPSRSEIEEKYKWNLTDIYKTDEEWEKDFKKLESNIKFYKKYEGKLHTDSNTLLECFNFDNENGILVERLYLYAMLSKDSDMRVPEYQSYDGRTKSIYSKVSTASAFIKPELLRMDENHLLNLINNEPELHIYKHFIEELLRTKNHTLSQKEEELLALTSETNVTPYNVFSMFTNADMKFPIIKDENGNDVEISHGRYYSAMFSTNREFRERAFKNYYKPFKDYSNTFSALLNGIIKVNIISAKARNYASALHYSLDRNNIPVSVYENLISSAGKYLKPMHRWASIKKKLLNINELHPYDTYVTVFSQENEKKYAYEQGKDLVLKSLDILGEDYLSSIKKAFENRWIDVYETQGKRSGAYSSGTTFGVHPYVLLNWTDLLNDVFTLTHEMGHNMHSYYTGISQPYPYANYSIFLAEVASTFNESLLLDYLIKNSNSKEEKLFLLERYLNNITSTFYRQIMFAEFELIIYQRTEKGESLTAKDFSNIYKELYQKYWGDAMVIDEEEEFTWARIPHFYYNFYVFQYATGLAASETLVKKVKEEGSEAVEKYLNFLKAGSSDYPLNILKNAGVDMNSPQPVIATTLKMNLLLDEMENLIN